VDSPYHPLYPDRHWIKSINFQAFHLGYLYINHRSHTFALDQRSMLLRTLRAPGWDIDDPRLPLVIFLAWMVLHNLGYMVYLPSISNASRYGAMNHISLWIALFSGLIFVRKPVYRTWLVTGLTIIALANTLYWNQVYDANLEHTLKVRISSAQYLRYKIPSSEKCAAIDIGAIKYYSELQFIDLGNLVDPR